MVGEKVFFTGASQTFADGDKLVHGQQGEVKGPGTGEAHKGKGVHALFPGNKGVVNLFLTQVRRPCAAASANAPRLRLTHATLCPCPVRSGDSLSAPRRPSLTA